MVNKISSISYQQKIARWQKLSVFPIKDIFICGLERETMRINNEVKIAKTSHPKSLGSALTHQYITTDFAESLLEIVTPPCNTIEELMGWLNDLHSFIDININEELMWSASMPPILDDPDNIKVAEYGSSYQGILRHIYRCGLALRYGRRMQAIAGLHLNFSFGEKFLEYYNQISDAKISPNTLYFNILRNYIRNSWLINYLFGSSPVLDKSFLLGMEVPAFLQSYAKSSYYHPHSSCLRMGSMGYNNRKHSSLSVCFNNLSEYLDTISKLLGKNEEEYQKLGIKDKSGRYQQLNTNVLQVENEYYASIRPKALRLHAEKTIDILMRKGVEYLEIRNLDINPFAPCGIDENQLRFMQLFLLYSSLVPSAPISSEECQSIRIADEQIIMNNINNDSDFKLEGGRTLNIYDEAHRIFTEMEPLAHLLDKAAQSSDYTYALQLQNDKLEDENLLPSIQQMCFLRNENMDFVEGIFKLSQNHKLHYASHRKENYDRQSLLKEKVVMSWQETHDLESNKSGSFEDYLAEYLTVNY